MLTVKTDQIMQMHMLIWVCSAHMTLYVFAHLFPVPPVVLVPVGTNFATANEAIVLPCQVYSDPPPSVIWFKGKQLLSEA